jgi:hypothetical protein
VSVRHFVFALVFADVAMTIGTVALFVFGADDYPVRETVLGNQTRARPAMGGRLLSFRGGSSVAPTA